MQDVARPGGISGRAGRDSAVRWLVLSAVFCAFAIQTYHLNVPDIWGDEAGSISRARLPLQELIFTTAETHPPLFSAFLAVWFPLAGSSPLSARFPAAACIVTSVALLFVLGRLLVSDSSGIVAAFLLATSPLAVFYGQEARMYAPGMAIGLAASVLVCRFAAIGSEAGAGNRRQLAAWLVLHLFGAATHFFTVFVLAAHDLAVLVQAMARRLRMVSIALWVGANFVIVAALAAWLAVQGGFLASQTRQASTPDWLDRFATVWREGLLAFAYGTVVPSQWPWQAALPVLALAALGTAALLRRKVVTGLYLISLVAVPIGLAAVLNPLMPVWSPRYVLNALPPFLLLAAAGATVPFERVGRRSFFRAAIATAFTFSLVAPAVLVNQAALTEYFGRGATLKGGYGQMMGYLREQARPGDGLLLLNPLQETLYDYYAPSDLPDYWFPLDQPITAPASQAVMREILSKHRRLWLVAFGDPGESDPGHELERWLASQAFREYRGDFVDSTLSLYVVEAGPMEGRQPINAQLGDIARLVGFRLSARTITPGETLRLALEWQAVATSSRRYTVFTHLLSESAVSPLGNRIWAQFDSEPVAGTRPMTTWKAGETIDDRYGLSVFPNTPAGEYELEVGMYDTLTGQRLAVMVDGVPVGDRVLLTRLRVTK